MGIAHAVLILAEGPTRWELTFQLRDQVVPRIAGKRSGTILAAKCRERAGTQAQMMLAGAWARTNPERETTIQL